MIQKPDAVRARDFALAAIVNLSSILNVLHDNATQEDYSKIKKAVGLSVGKIQTDILDLLNLYYPELDDLK